MRIGPDGIDPLYEPGRLILVSVSEDYYPEEDESRSEVDFGPNGTITFVDGITGYSNTVEIDEFQLEQLFQWTRTRLTAQQNGGES